MGRNAACPAAPQVKKLQRCVLAFYRTRRRDLPWRKTRDPYRILVSEIMLQQTQVDRVVPKYREFLRRFPHARSLAAARFGDVLRAWIGLGYNGRALRLWRCARAIVREHHGRVPSDPRVLETLPGIGPYTAAAVASFAFGAQLVVIDTNVRRVLSRTLAARDAVPVPRLATLARAALPAKHGAQWAQALMDVGALFCRPAPRCQSCPAHAACAFALQGRAPARSSLRRSQPYRSSDRFYRGRVMKLLAGRPSIPRREVGEQVKEGFGASDAAWLNALIRGLERDGLIIVDRVRQRLRLP
jgi:A/G-specific adenine glycosylase